MVNKIFLYLIFIILVQASSKTEITAKKFDVNDKEGITKFIGNVKVVQGEDRIYEDLINVFTDKKRHPIKYEAIGSVRFKIKTDTSLYTGKSKKLYYYPLKKEYQLIGDARVNENDDSKVLIGEKIIINKTTGKAKVFGDRKPVKFIFDSVEE